MIRSLSSRRNLLRALFLSSGAFILAYLYPPFYFYIAGTDASIFASVSYRVLYGHESSYNFIPPGTDLSKARILDETFTDVRGDKLPKEKMIGIMTPYVVINREREIEFSHFRLYPWVLGAVRLLGESIHAAEYLNYFLLFVGLYFLHLIIQQVIKSELASLFAALSLYLIPTFMAVAREPISELMAFALNMALLYAALTNRIVISGILVALLSWTRGEYILIALVYLLWTGWNGLRHPKTAAFVVGSLWLLNWHLYSYVFNYVNPDAYMPYLLLLGLFSPVLVLIGLVLGRCNQAFEPLVNRLTKALISKAPFLIFITLVALFFYDLSKFESGITRYSTFDLLWKSTGWLLPIGAISLLMNTSLLLNSISLLVFVLFTPHFFVLYDMGASPINTVYWTRRFVAAIYPILALGLAYFFYTVFSFFRSPKIRNTALVGTALIFYLGMVTFHSETFKNTPANVLSRSEVEKFDSSASKLPPNAIVILSSQNYSLKGSLPLRTRHGLWSFNVWNSNKLGEALEALPKDYPLFVEKNLISLLDKSKFNSSDNSKEMEVYVGESSNVGENRLIELVSVARI